MFLGERDDELAFVPGDIIEVFLDVDTGIPGWSRGRLGKCVGLFPTDFVAATGAGVSLVSTDRSDRPPSYHSSEMVSGKKRNGKKRINDKHKHKQQH